jgi:hypothetical protein
VSRFELLRGGRRGRRLLLAGALILGAAVTIAAPADAVPPIGPTPTPDGTVTLSAAPVVSLANAQAITFTVNTAGGTTLVGHITAHLCIHGFTTYGLSNFGYSDSSASRCVYQAGIVSGGITGGDYEKVYPSYAGSETTSGPLTFKAGTGAVTWGNALGYGPFTLTADSAHMADLVIQVNLAGDSVPTTYFIQPLTFAGAPGAPTAVKAQPGSAAATVSWVAPANHGVSAISGYVVTPFLGATAQAPRTFNTPAVTQTITGLTNASAYTFKVQAKNSAGNSALSVASNAVTVGAPTTPAAATAVSGSTTTTTGPITVTYSQPTSNNGAAITKFTATCVSGNGGATKTGIHTGATAAAIVVAGATTAKSYTCTVTATNARGTSPPSAPSAPLIVGAPAKVAVPNAAPGSTTTATGPINVTYAAPADNGAAITQFTATCVSSNGGATKTGVHTGATAVAIAVAGATTGKLYTCTVTATNARGTGQASPPSPAITVGAPARIAQPTVANTATGVLKTTFTNLTAAQANGSPLTAPQYTATCTSSNGGVTKSGVGATSPISVAGLTAAKTYTCTVKAHNARGFGRDSSPSAAHTA